MYSWAAIWASVRPWATRVTSSRSRALSFPRPGGARALLRAGGGEHQGVLGGGGQAHRRAAFLGRARPAGSERLPGLRAAVPAGGARPRADPGTPRARKSAADAAHTVTASAWRPVAAHRCPQQSRPSSSVTQAAGPHGDLECFPQVRRGVLGAARPQVQIRHLRQQARLVPQVARLPGPGQPRRADTLGGGQVPGLDQHARSAR